MLCHDSNFTCCNQIEFRCKLQSLALKYYHNFNPYKIFSVIFSRNDLNLLKKISTNKDIIVCKPDKGRAVVIRQTYTNSIMSIFSDHSKFTEIFDSISVFSTKIEDKIDKFLRKLKIPNKISD